MVSGSWHVAHQLTAADDLLTLFVANLASLSVLELEDVPITGECGTSAE